MFMKLFNSLCATMLVAAMGFATAFAEEQKITKTWAIAEFGEPLYRDNFTHWPYVNPDAPKGGRIVLRGFGTFDSLNPIILKGEWPTSLGLMSDSLMAASGDELSSAYGLIAETVEYPEDKSWIIFNLRPEAHYHDGVPITAGDFVFAYDAIMAHGRPFLKSFYADVEKVEALDDRRLKVSFKTRHTMKPLLTVSGFSPRPRHYWETRDISKTYLEPPLTSGPYRIKSLEAGRSITYERVKDYWGKDLAINLGINNFDEIHYDFYRDLTIAFEAFKAGEVDYVQENSSKRWTNGYDIEQVKENRIVKRVLPDQTPQAVQAYFFNQRRSKFSDERVREAIGYLYDFEAVQRTFLYGLRKRSKSYFPNSEYGASGPPTAEELAILEPFRNKLKPQVLTEAFEPPKTDGSGRIRRNLRKALALFKEAGWVLENQKLINTSSGEQLSIEFLLGSPTLEPFANAFVKNLERAGILGSVRIVDTAQYSNRVDDWDFDIITVRLNFFPPPGAEMRNYYGSAAADVRGSANMGGIKNEVVDALIEQIIDAKDLDILKATTRALDRVLLWDHNIIPQYHDNEFWIAYWNRFGYPERNPRYAVGFINTWWVDEALEAQLAKR